MPGRMEFEFQFSKTRAPLTSASSDNRPMRFLIMGDFGGRGHRGQLEDAAPLGDRPIMRVDVDNFENVMSRVAPRLHLRLGGASGQDMIVQFGQLGDFHPDELYGKLEVFQALRVMRARLLDPATFVEAAEELKGPAGTQAASTQPTASSGSSEVDAADGTESEFERLLGGKPVESQARPGTSGRPAAQPAGSQADVIRFIRDIVAPHILPETDPQQRQFVASIDVMTAELMRDILHDPDFQALESAWRAMHWLVSKLETGQELGIYLLDVTREELAADISAVGSDLAASKLHRLLVEQGVQTPGGQPWSLLVGNFTFGTERHDVALLAALGAIASQAGGPFLAQAEPAVFDCRSLVETPDPRDWRFDDPAIEERWQALRTSSAASWIGLAVPRVMLRLPYGSQTDPIEPFEFEELSIRREHEAYLWGNPAFACAMLIAMSFQEQGWSMRLDDHLVVDDLPAHAYEDDAGESTMKPCAEVFLSERGAEAILRRGVMPVMSYRNRNAVRVTRFQSVADPPAPLAGPWA